MKIPRRSALIAGLAAVALLIPVSPVYAMDEPNSAADAVAAAVADVAPVDVESATLEKVSTGVVAPLDGGGLTHLATDPSAGVTVTTPNGEVVSFSLPAAAQLGDAAIADDGSVTYLGTDFVPSVNVAAATEGVRVSTVIDAKKQDERFAYDFGPGATVEILDAGGAIAYVVESFTNPETGETGPVEKIIAEIAAPWAKDANGTDVPTRYEADGSSLIQVVDHRDGNFAYPVVADPYFDQPNIIQYRIRFTRSETRTIANGGAGMIASVGCGPMLPVCVLAGATIWWQASLANDAGRCVQVTATQPMVVPGVIWWVDQYSVWPC